MRRRVVAALSAGVAGLALGVMPATGAYAANQVTADRGCSDWRGGGCGHYNDYRDYRHHDRYYDRHYYDRYYYDDFNRNFNDVVVILVAAR
ncbi:hypothetical protein [Streptomyces sp. I6]|uniref:hypothetical protein n=1 Tax=Streptomyces sp. I6 TaxID=2483113 RepID=UPI00288056F6|nr:hypothetical protein [Streptomyces sp. I6]